MNDRNPLLWAGLAFATVVIVLVGAFVVRELAGDDGRAGSVPPSLTTASPTAEPVTDPHPDLETLTAQAIVGSQNSRLQSFVTSPTNPNVRAAIWSLCLNTRRCSPQLHAAVFTDDGFDTSHYLILPRSGSQVLLPAGRRQFYVSAGRNDR